MYLENIIMNNIFFLNEFISLINRFLLVFVLGISVRHLNEYSALEEVVLFL